MGDKPLTRLTQRRSKPRTRAIRAAISQAQLRAQRLKNLEKARAKRRKNLRDARKKTKG